MPIPPPVETKPFMTYVPTRRPQWKTHKNIGQAKNAILNKISYGYNSGSGYTFVAKTGAVEQSMQVHYWEDDQWKLLWDIPKGTPYAELPWVNTPDIKAKQAQDERASVLKSLERTFVANRDLDKLRQVWDAKVTEPIENQVDFYLYDYL